MSRITFVVALQEFNAIRKGSQTSVFRESNPSLVKRLKKDYDFIEIRNGVMSNRPKIFFKYVGFEKINDGYRVYFGEKEREENMKDEFKLVGEKLCK